MNAKELNYQKKDLPEQTMKEYIEMQCRLLESMDPWERRKLAEEIAVAAISA
jgi:hypothetical protein